MKWNVFSCDHIPCQTEDRVEGNWIPEGWSLWTKVWDGPSRHIFLCPAHTNEIKPCEVDPLNPQKDSMAKRLS